jgi:hypothetical protein
MGSSESLIALLFLCQKLTVAAWMSNGEQRVTTLKDGSKKPKERFFFINPKEYTPFLDADSGSVCQESIYCAIES